MYVYEEKMSRNHFYCERSDFCFLFEEAIAFQMDAESQTSLHSEKGKMNMAHTDGPAFVPAGVDVGEVSHGAAVFGEVAGVEYRQRAVDVALHCVSRLLSIWVHRERPVVYQPWNHV